MINSIKRDAVKRMVKSVYSLSREFAKIRTGRAHVNLLDHIMISYYGSNRPLKQIANITVENSRTLVVQPWEKGIIQIIEKALIESNLGLLPKTSDTIIRVSLSPLTEERRKDLIRVVRAATEQARIAIRNIRRDANNEFKILLKKKLISKDDEHQGQEIIQQLTHKYIKQIKQILEQKEKDLMVI